MQADRTRCVIPSAALAALVTLALPGCSSQQLYGAGQAWQQQACVRILDAQERSRCMASTQSSYEAYRKEAEAAKGSRP